MRFVTPHPLVEARLRRDFPRRMISTERVIFLAQLAEPQNFGDDFSTAHAHAMLDFYCKTLVELGYRAEPYPDVDEHIGDRKLGTPRFETLNHALWMCEQCRQFLRSGRLAKAYRWIGTIQGILLMNGIFSIMELKNHNRLSLPAVKSRGSNGSGR